MLHIFLLGNTPSTVADVVVTEVEPDRAGRNSAYLDRMQMSMVATLLEMDTRTSATLTSERRNTDLRNCLPGERVEKRGSSSVSRSEGLAKSNQ